ncbi:FMN-binding protein [Ignavibacteria bacterium 4148-Me]|uniref:FMN-binding protein n=1 Tax=Rosettibacter primus TaxID=3111523 RepID=UPI00336C0BF8
MKKTIKIIVVLTIIGIISGALLTKVNEWASPLIAANKKAETEKGIFLVQPDGKYYEKINTNDIEIYKVFDDNKNFIGYSLAFEGNGFQGKIRLMVGLSTDLNKITSLEILEQVETPGLGTKITEEPFKNQFKGLQTFPQINWIKGKTPEEPNEIQTITGATISSKSVVAIVNNGIQKARSLKERGSL